MTQFIDSILKKINQAPCGQLSQEKLTRHIDRLTMPHRALGRLLDLAEQLTFASCRVPLLECPAIVVFVAEQGVAQESVSAYPNEVTRQMLVNFLRRGAAINQLAKHSQSQLKVVNVATAGHYDRHPDLIDRPVASSSHNLLYREALDEDKMHQAIELGYQVALKIIDDGCDLFVAGEMGIGNTTTSACLTALITDKPIEKCVGRGTGVQDDLFENKKRVVKQALERTGLANQKSKEPFKILKEVGGYDHAAVLGSLLACAEKRVPFLLDGFNITASAALASLLDERVKEVLIASHCGSETGHQVLLDFLNLNPYFEWQLRLGEGSGAALMIPLCQQAVTLVSGMATFEQAQVTQKEIDLESESTT